MAGTNPPTETELHADLRPIATLIGTWSGHGVGRYPTIEDFTYDEEITFRAPPGKPFLVYHQHTRRAGDHPEAGAALHTEAGYLRPVGPDQVEMVVAQPTGIVEAHAGRIENGVIHLESTLVGATPTAKDVSAVERRLEVAGDVLTYELWMTAVGQAHTIHLDARLERVG